MVELQQQRKQETDKNMERDSDDDYLQLLDAGEHMYGMFVGENYDLYAYLRSNDEQDCEYYHEYYNDSSESIEDVLSRSVGGLFLCGGDVFEQGTSTNEKNCDDSNSEDERSATAGRVTPTKDMEQGHHDDAMIE
mmetsp:Transcript_26988/g.74196  ORF Transcript_26988/g.74196 Transcript_26988/m.74196 type:complete len:135 (+) Transcript_26988:129-533(+)|eukprot:CAMPEP_0172362974 /NCGR_PEP_ID=MMETSP1060-20121228/6456_1 /TAXON_ID=37318 /ORGANISM="Pseudo-nitzschia pungens, Strain cf. cingulata" /LENGTH=134 /DNA_ID=CAMNT_0013085601 /DNA_START=56 /DNA_END=460 /DNA_ORIENTATION=-